MRKLVPLVAMMMLVSSGFGRADPSFIAQIRLLKSKADQCKAEMQTVGKAARFCDDFQQYSDFVFKGSAQSYMEYHLSNGDITNANSEIVLNAMKSAVTTLSMIPSYMR